MPNHPVVCVTLYVISCLLDAVDGHAARALDQCSKFGAVLDMVTDRCTTTCLLCFLASVYPTYAVLFQFLISLDISSHYMHMYSSLTEGAESHKQIKEDSNPFLRAYYKNNNVLFFMCAGNELFFVALYVLATTKPLPVFEYDLRLILATVTFPICAAKQIINVIQFVNASKSLASIDIEDRRAKRALKKE
ncbi:hypothetical protein BC936DRAFT_145607 [Jimgerdemannia flammicorona]|nr:hypothetical protein BC936DRAFT_145607 [Jimgerdemannia flammicorona]